MNKIYLVKGTRLKEISASVMLELMLRYTVAGAAFNKGQLIYLHSRRGSRIHSLIVCDCPNTGFSAIGSEIELERD